MGRMINTDAAYAVLTDYYHHSTDTQHQALREALGRVESVDAVPVRHGYWIRHDYADIVDGYYVPNYECSVCHTWKQDDSDYCPDCGANLDGRDCDGNG